MAFQPVARRYDRGSIVLPSNKPFSDWGQVLADDVLATAILDRLPVTRARGSRAEQLVDSGSGAARACRYEEGSNLRRGL